jgi:superfamily II DNA/RNA helicase
MGGIQHIICSATLTIDNTGRITPRKREIMQKNKSKDKPKVDEKTTLELLCQTLRFRSNNPRVIDLTEEGESGSMPDTLKEFATRCKVEEKDLYLYYFLQQKRGESVIIFSNSITATRRLNSLLDFLKIKNHCLHSKMQ